MFDQHPDRVRSARAGIGPQGPQIPVLCVQSRSKLTPVETERVHFDLLQLAQAHAITRSIRTVLFHPGIPLDAGHRSAIRRGELADWAAEKIDGWVPPAPALPTVRAAARSEHGRTDGGNRESDGYRRAPAA